MLIDFFIKLRDYKVPVSLNEFLIFLEALGKDFIEFDCLSNFVVFNEININILKNNESILKWNF